MLQSHCKGNKEQFATILDCTLRDGGFVNDWQFPIPSARSIVNGLNVAGVDIIELGYRTSRGILKDEDKFGPWRFVDEKLINDVSDPFTEETRFSLMLELGRADINDVPPAHESPISLYRIAIYLPQLRDSLSAVETLKKLGYSVSLNIAEVSTLERQDLIKALGECRYSDLDIVYLVDTRGALLPKLTYELTQVYCEHLYDIPVGIHAHNNYQLALANTLIAIDAGASFADASLFGIGRGSGNCGLEQLLFAVQNPRYQIAPILDLIEHIILPLFDSVPFPWGYQIPYLLTAALEEHHKVVLRGSPHRMRNGFSDLFRELETSLKRRKDDAR